MGNDRTLDLQQKKPKDYYEDIEEKVTGTKVDHFLLASLNL